MLNISNNSDSETHLSEFIHPQNSTFLPNSNIVKYDSASFESDATTNSSSIIKCTRKLLQELYITLLDTEIAKYDIDELNEYVNNFLFENDLNPENVLEFMTNNSQNISHYSSLIGYFYKYGIGCEVDEIRAVEIFSNAVKNDQKAVSNQFSFHQKGTFCDDNNDEIKKLNEIVLQYFYTLFLYKDIIINRRNNYKLHIENAEKGNPVSQYYIGNCYYYGINIEQNYNKAIQWYLKSSEGGNAEAIDALVECYYSGFGIAEDKEKAFELYLKSAEKGHKLALYMVGKCYYSGEGILKNENEAFKWYLKAAEKGHTYSQYLVASWYSSGTFIPKDEEKGFYWIRKAAINGDIYSQYGLAEYYLNDSINKNEKKAFKWYLKLANKNYEEAMPVVEKCYRNGIGTDKNQIEATKWLKKHNDIVVYD